MHLNHKSAQLFAVCKHTLYAVYCKLTFVKDAYHMTITNHVDTNMPQKHIANYFRYLKNIYISCTAEFKPQMHGKYEAIAIRCSY